MTIPLKTEIERLLSEALDGLAGNGLPEEVRGIVPNVERARDPRHGDFATNLAMGLAKPARQAPRQIAEAIIRKRADAVSLVNRCEEFLG